MMNKYSEHTARILLRAISLIGNYRDGKASLRYLVDSLEGSVKSLEEQLPNIFYDDWYSHWGELEAILALGEETQRGKEILEELNAMETLIGKYTVNAHNNES